MFGFGDKPQPAQDLIKDATEATFLADVVEACADAHAHGRGGR